MKRLLVVLLVSALYWGAGLAVWGAFFLADLLGDCLDQAICVHDKPVWLLSDLAVLCVMVVVYGVMLAMLRRRVASSPRTTGEERFDR